MNESEYYAGEFTDDDLIFLTILGVIGLNNIGQQVISSLMVKWPDFVAKTHKF